MKQKTLIVIDVQNEFCHPDGFFAKNLCECNSDGFFGEDKLTTSSIDETVDNIQCAIERFKSSGLPVVYIKGVSDPEYVSKERFSRYGNMYLEGFLKDGTWSTDFYRLRPNQDEAIFKKGAYDPFQNPNFKKYVQDNASELILVGFFSDVCIDAAARSADQRDVGVPTSTIANCSMGLYRNHQENLRFMEMFYGTTVYDTLEDIK